MTSKATLDDNFKLLLSGIDGLHVGAVLTNDDAHVLPNFTLPVGAAPVLPSVEDNLEQILTSPENLPLYKDQSVHRLWAREPCVESLYNTTLMPVQTDICVERDHRTGQLCGYKEDLLDQSFAANKSMSLHRQPGPPEQTLRGSSSNYPFWPGGLDEPKSDLLKQSGSLIDLENELLTIAPGLDSGMPLPKQSIEKFIQESSQQQNFSQISLLDVLTGDHEFDLLTHSPDEDNINTDDMPPVDIHDQDIDTLIKDNVSEETDTPSKKAPTTTDDNKWAIAVDIKTTVHDFHKKIPDMAFKWPFELDVFQKQAILCLEQNQNVFVAAHTSAGKTVVAEYAVALCMRHMTKSIYTSPIKALSNQKFRDFKNTFGDVGLVTGDVQLQPEASCLIMTTEILRSMLYNGSDTIRDLECVIFDEVHYINDADRGVVWEEVLIMLPDHVKIVLLSATVPNTMEFANWIGRIKRKHVYVVSTTKRPVPLEHFLYTGNSNKTSNELFRILDAQNKFSEINYKKAVAAKKERASKSAMTTGPKGHRSGAGGIQQDKAIWLSLIEMLRKKDKLPVVAFVFSKKNIDQTSSRLQNVDLTSTTEKAEIHTFFQKCVTRLKGSDRQLPQVKLMSDSLKRGLGIHHSGILPILREVVEMLFAKGLVKVLFATETFAMGVNMPARTVVFDNTRKHDGINFRDLLPGEYIQMAGRSGRRGLDATGTVILLCKGDVTPIIDLHRMMLGKPTQLESQFRLTYTMMLNLLRVEQLRVEDMMKRSFSEFHNQQKAGEQQETLKNLLREAELLPEVQDYSGDLQRYYDTCDEYWTLKQELQFVIMTHPQATQALSPGRVLVIDTPQHTNALALLLQVTQLKGSDSKTFTVLVMCDICDNETICDNATTEGNNEYPRPVKAAKFFYPNGPCGHRVLEIDGQYITQITRKIIKQPSEKILQNWKQRQIPRFSDTPPNQPTMTAVQELCRIVESNPNDIQALDPVKDFKLRDLDLVDKFTKLNQFKERFLGFMCVHDPLFEENFMQLRKHMKIQKKCVQLKYLLSDESLMLLPEYQQRIEVLKGLNYIDETHTVQLKGRVACEMSSHELILTELLFDNALTALHPTEIAALLSCVVFDMKKVDEPQLHSDLEKAREHFIQVATMIGELQKAQKLPIEVQDYVGQFKFGLMEVVFEWARGMPFCDITALTSVQEGVIVRCIQRLDEVLRDVYKAARIVGDQVLCTKMQEAITAIKRDIVFTASLYTQ